MRIAVIKKDKCKPDRCNYLCASVCPVNKSGSDPAVLTEGKYPEIVEELCIGCGICVKKCPFGAIIIVNTPEEVGTPVHQYGRNGFRLYGLPFPKKGKIVGILGPNGTGKSTAIKILSGHVIPNFGEGGGEKRKVIERFKGSELQNYFEELYEKGKKVVVKPQEIEKIPKMFDGTVRELLSSYGDAEEIAERLGIKEILDRKISVLSGGELQLTALAVALMRDSDLLFVDEPSSYLDVKQRMKIAEIIHEEREKRDVLVVEHDLAVLDYISDGIFIVFGVPGAYGMFSGFKGVLEGINQYLDGYLREENIRFREEGLYFDVRAGYEHKRKILFTYPEIVKEFEGFRMRAEEGDVKEGEIIGIIGPNGTGKTTFIKALVEEIDADLAYKPQYVNFPDVLVKELFTDVDRERFREVDKKLNISDLFEKEAPNLSGGEKQRVAVALALSKEADIYFLDEPSAFLDVEQRTECAHLIRKMVSGEGKAGFVVDHDLLFIDHVSDRLIVFEGVPGKEGKATPPLAKKEGMNRFLKEMGITFRRDPTTGRPRVNKKGSQKDMEQKKKGEYYYM